MAATDKAAIRKKRRRLLHNGQSVFTHFIIDPNFMVCPYLSRLVKGRLSKLLIRLSFVLLSSSISAFILANWEV